MEHRRIRRVVADTSGDAANNSKSASADHNVLDEDAVKDRLDDIQSYCELLGFPRVTPAVEVVPDPVGTYHLGSHRH